MLQKVFKSSLTVYVKFLNIEMFLQFISLAGNFQAEGF